MAAGPVDLTITFLSPVEVGDPEPSFPYVTSHRSYLAQRSRQPIAPLVILLYLRGTERREIAPSSSLCRYQWRVGDRDQQSRHKLDHYRSQRHNTPSADCEPIRVLRSQRSDTR